MSEQKRSEIEELEVTPERAIVLSPTQKPTVFFAQASQLAKEVSKVIEDAGLVTEVAGRKYVSAAGFATLASMFGLGTVVEDWGVVRHEGQISYVWAKVSVRKGEVVVGSAIGVATYEEGAWRRDERWSERPLQHLVSLAQTRAMRKALSNLLAPILALTRYETTVTAEEAAQQAVSATSPAPAAEAEITAADWARFWIRVRELGFSRNEVHLLFDVSSLKEIVHTKQDLQEILAVLEEEARRRSE